MAVPAMLLSLTLGEGAAGTNGGREVNIEMSKEQLEAMLASLSKVKEQVCRCQASNAFFVLARCLLLFLHVLSLFTHGSWTMSDDGMAILGSVCVRVDPLCATCRAAIAGKCRGAACVSEEGA